VELPRWLVSLAADASPAAAAPCCRASALAAPGSSALGFAVFSPPTGPLATSVALRSMVGPGRFRPGFPEGPDALPVPDWSLML
jgi:hypothetical protein